MKTQFSTAHRLYIAYLMLLIGVLSGCGGGGGSNTPTAVGDAPPSPDQAKYAVITPNYFDRYNIGNADPPFDTGYQFTDRYYPIPVSFALDTEEPQGVSFTTNSEQAVRAWAAADPRVCVISSVATSKARIQMVLRRTISYAGQSNIIGLTTVRTGNVPSFIVEVATQYLPAGGDPSNPNDYVHLSANEVVRTITHELGHTLGLGHSPDTRDLMYFQSNNNQGMSFATYITFGDAMTIWTTLNARGISWVSSRPPISYAEEAGMARGDAAAATRGDAVVCVYAMP